MRCASRKAIGVAVLGVLASMLVLGLGSWAVIASSGATWPKALLVADGAVVVLGPLLLPPWWAARRVSGERSRTEDLERRSVSPIFTVRRLAWSVVVCVVTLAVGLAVRMSDPGDALGDAAIVVTAFLVLLIVGGVASRAAK